MSPDRDDPQLELERLRWRLQALDEWRKEVEQQVGRLEARVSELVQDGELAKRIAARVSKQAQARFTHGEKLAAALAGAIVAGCSLGGFLLQLLGHGGRP